MAPNLDHITPVTPQIIQNVLKSNLASVKGAKAGILHSDGLEKAEKMWREVEVLLRKIFGSKSAPPPNPPPVPKREDIKFNEENELTFRAIKTTLNEHQKAMLILLNNILRGIDCSNNELDPAYEPIFEDTIGLLFEDMDNIESRSFLSRVPFNPRFTMAQLHGFSDDAKVPFCDNSFAFLLQQKQEDGKQREHVDVAIAVNIYYARVTVSLDKMTLSKHFLAAIDAALAHGETRTEKYDALAAVFDRFGHVFCTKLYLGGKLFTHFTDVEITKGKEEEAKKDVVVWSASSEEAAQANQAYGGDNRLFEIPAKWISSTKPFDTWRVIEYIDLVPTYTLLDKERRRKVELIFNVFRGFI